MYFNNNECLFYFNLSIFLSFPLELTPDVYKADAIPDTRLTVLSTAEC